MDKVSKAIQKINSKDALKISDALEDILNSKAKNLDIKKLRGYDDIFRVRVCEYRIIYQKNNHEMNILEISKRNDSTYKNY